MPGYIRPRSLLEALEARAAHPEAVPVAGGTDLMVDVNAGRAHPAALLDLSGVEELGRVERADGHVRIGAGVTYRSLIARLDEVLPALVGAGRSVGSPPIRNQGTIGGNLGSASPAGDCHPPLLAYGASVRLERAGGARTVPAEQFFVGPKRSVLRPDELITRVDVPLFDGPQAFAKVGSRNAMVIAVCSLALVLHPSTSAVGTGIGSAGPVPLRAAEAEAFLEGHLTESRAWETGAPLADPVVERFAQLVSESARPIDDVRGLALYRRHAVRVLARRMLTWCWEDYRRAGWRVAS